VYPFSDVRDAFAQLATGHLFGKVVVEAP
jgi:hypothetical protein